MTTNNVIAFPFNTYQRKRTRADSLTIHFKISQIILYALDHIGTENCNVVIFSDGTDVATTKNESPLSLTRQAVETCSKNPFDKVYQNKIISPESTSGITDPSKNEQRKCTYRCLSYAITSMDGGIIGKFYLYDRLPQKYSESEVFTFTILGAIIENLIHDSCTFLRYY